MEFNFDLEQAYIIFKNIEARLEWLNDNNNDSEREGERRICGEIISKMMEKKVE